MNGPLELGWMQLAGAAALLLLNAGLSVALRLGLERTIAVAAVRAAAQLALLGLVLESIFGWDRWEPVAGWCFLMIVLAARAGVRRSKRRYTGIDSVGFVALAVAGGSTAWLATTVLIGVEPWWAPRYLIPLLGMILGNALTGISLGLDRCLQELDEGAERVDLALALGATRSEAARPVAAEALRAGMIPILNSMTVVGLVTIPGMMTGQLLGGVDPGTAARYQLLILFLIAAATAAGTGLAVFGSLRALFDDQHRLRRERISLR